MFKRGGHTVDAGTYWNMANGSRIDMRAEGILPGGQNAIYIKASSGLVLAAAPLLGLVFAVFLPFIGIAMAVMLIVRKVGAGMRDAAAASTSFAWRPIEAYLTGRKKKKAVREKKGGKKS